MMAHIPLTSYAEMEGIIAQLLPWLEGIIYNFDHGLVTKFQQNILDFIFDEIIFMEKYLSFCVPFAVKSTLDFSDFLISFLIFSRLF